MISRFRPIYSGRPFRILILAAVALAGCSKSRDESASPRPQKQTEQEGWNLLVRDRSVEACRTFLDRFPDSPRRNRAERLLWEKTLEGSALERRHLEDISTTAQLGNEAGLALGSVLRP